MNKILPIIVAIIIVGFIAYSLNDSTDTIETVAKPVSPKVTVDSAEPLDAGEASGALSSAEGYLSQAEKPATELYDSAERAMESIKKAAADYDDLVLEQFTELSATCSWCAEVYDNVQQLMLSPDISDDERSFYAELLAVSGRPDNIRMLVESVKNAPNEDYAEIYAEALEFTIGDDRIVELLADELGSSNELLQEASVAAITNQSSRLAAETLYDHTLKAGDGDGFYDLGIGLGEFIPNDDVLPYLQEKARQYDQYSHLAVKAMLNNGINGLRSVFDLLANTSSESKGKELLENAVDHVIYEDEVEPYVREMAANPPNELSRQFANEILEDFEIYDQEELEEGE